MDHDSEDEIRNAIRQAVADLHFERGLDLGAVISIANAELISGMIEVFGSEATAGCLSYASSRIRAIPEQQKLDLASVAPAGRA